MRLHRNRVLAACLSATALLSACGSSSTSNAGPSTTAAGAAPKEAITIGSQGFTENEVLAYVYADALKAAGYTVTVKPNLGAREVVEPALASGQIDMTPEYLGNFLTYLKPDVGVLSVAQTASTLAPLATAKGLTLGMYSPAADSDAVAVTQANASKFGLKSIADLTKVASGWTFGGPPECATRITCLLGLQKFYGVNFKSFKALDADGPITRSALNNGDVQAARIFSSDTTVSSDHFVVLTDPMNYQGAGNIVPVIRTPKVTPDVMAILDKVSTAMTTADLVAFNVATGTNHDDPTTVASNFVSSHKL